jgi:hypothetical protein
MADCSIDECNKDLCREGVSAIGRRLKQAKE